MPSPFFIEYDININVYARIEQKKKGDVTYQFYKNILSHISKLYEGCNVYNSLAYTKDIKRRGIYFAASRVFKEKEAV